ncbi:MAG TPA: DUF1361 domain-containing protein [Gaiellaceae bacterium]|jgi:uncharacterized membrane protein
MRVLISLGALAGASALCVALLLARVGEQQLPGYSYLVWNLALAWIPLLLAGLLVVAYRLGRSTLELLVLGAGWLVFLPNAPYVLTDFVHVGQTHRLFDTLVIAAFALTALVIGFVSLVLVQLVVTRAAGALFGWLVAIGSLFAASVGIYLGRVQRVNSWDVVTRPRHLLELVRIRADDPFGNRHLIGFTLALGCLLALAYLGLYGFTVLASELNDRARVSASRRAR